MTTRIAVAIQATALVLAALASQTSADQFRYGNIGPKTVRLGGAYAGLKDLSGVTYTDGTGECCYPVVFDTGASGMVMSDFTRDSLLIPGMPGATYEDFGIGGEETFDVSQSTQLFLAPITISSPDSLTTPPYVGMGAFDFQVRQEDPAILGFPVVIDIVGTPVLNQHVLHVAPNSAPPYIIDGLVYRIEVMDTELLPSLPTDLPLQNTLRVDLNYVDFSTGGEPVSLAPNPFIPGVTINDSRLPAHELPGPTAWLLDSGGTSNLASRAFLGQYIDYAAESPIDSIQAIGIGNTLISLEGYRVDEIVIPAVGGHEIIFENPIIYVPPDGQDFPPGVLTGVLGVNNFAESFSELDPFTGQPVDARPSPFEHWYVDPFGEQLVLVDPLIVVPEPRAWALSIAGVVLFSLGTLLIRTRRNLSTRR